MEDANAFKAMMRMQTEDFMVLLDYIEKDITATPINGGHEAIPKAGLAVTCRFSQLGRHFGLYPFNPECPKQHYLTSLRAYLLLLLEIWQVMFRKQLKMC